MIAWSQIAFATSSFDPTTPQQRFEGQETWTQAQDVRLWNALERWDDPDRDLFRQESFNQGLAWKDGDASPWIATAFGTSTPMSSTFLLHVGIHEASAEGTPILMVPGAGDNGSRGFVTLATHFDKLNRPVYALTFGHPHGDVLMQAEIVADAIAVIKQRTGAEQIDLVGHSKGGLAVAAYLAHHEGADWGRPDYESSGTPYRGDVRKVVFVATPLGGVDTSFRWTGNNLFSLDPKTAVSPSAWSLYYPGGVLLPPQSLADQDFLPDGKDYFPGQRQVLRRQAAKLPGKLTWLGLYAEQPDWLTTYEGGLGFESRSDGIDKAIKAGGSFIDTLAGIGLDPGPEVYQLAGRCPLMANADPDLIDQFDVLGDLIDYRQLVSDLGQHGTPIDATDDDYKALENGTLVLGEITGPADGLVFVDSATDDRAVTARGNHVVEAHVSNLSHLDLLYASPITGQLLIDDAAAGGPDDQWMKPVGERYLAEDSIGWIEGVLADPPSTTTGTAPATSSTPIAGEPAGDPNFGRPCGSCESGRGGSGSGLGGIGLLAVAIAIRRRR